MKLLIGGSSSKMFHLNEFSKMLDKLNVETKLVFDSDYADGFPSRKFSRWMKKNDKFEKLIEEFKPDLILVDRQRHFGLEATKINIPLLVHLRGNHWKEIEMAKKTLYKSIPKKIAINKWEEIAERCFNNSEMIMPICMHLDQIVKRKYPDIKSCVMYQGIEPKNWFPSDGMKLKHPCVGLIQGLNIWGKTRELITLKKILEKLPDVTFYLAGDGEYSQKIIPELTKFDNFVWLKNLEYPQEIKKLFSEIDIFLSLSGLEGLGQTIIEALLMKKPVIATKIGGIPELIINNQTGLLVKQGDSEKIIENILKLLKDTEFAKNIAETGYDKIQKTHSWKKLAEEFEKILKTQ